MSAPEKRMLGLGVLTWNAHERRSDRYGAVWLVDAGGDDGAAPLRRVAGKGELWAFIVDTRQSHHIGDLFRGLSPETPDKDEWIKLGEGEIFYDKKAVGLKPEDRRDSDWLDPTALYRVHDQTVELWFQPSLDDAGE